MNVRNARHGNRSTGKPQGLVVGIVIGLVIVMLPFVCLSASAQEGLQDALEDLFEHVVGHRSGMYYTWRGESEEVITLTAIAPTVGDTYIDADNRLYEVVSVSEDRTVQAVYRETIRLPEVVARVDSGTSPSSPVGGTWHVAGAPVEAAAGQNNVVGIYHSHNAESYVESSGAEFIEPHGEVVDVGQVLAEALEEQGLRVVHSDNSHLPHDGGAYQRSRATVRELLNEDVVALVDVHRDAIPADEYVTEIDGEPMTRIRIVVGRQNPNREANLELAQRIKAMADERYPGLVKGIFHAAGNYNQDVGPRAILLEFGTHETSAQDAAKSARLFAEVYPAAAGLTPDSAKEAGRQIGGAGWRSALWFVVLAGGAVFAYLWVNEGSPQAAWERIRSFIAREAGKARTELRDGDGDGT